MAEESKFLLVVNFGVKFGLLSLKSSYTKT